MQRTEPTLSISLVIIDTGVKINLTKRNAFLQQIKAAIISNNSDPNKYRVTVTAIVFNTPITYSLLFLPHFPTLEKIIFNTTQPKKLNPDLANILATFDKSKIEIIYNSNIPTTQVSHPYIQCSNSSYRKRKAPEESSRPNATHIPMIFFSNNQTITFYKTPDTSSTQDENSINNTIEQVLLHNY